MLELSLNSASVVLTVPDRGLIGQVVRLIVVLGSAYALSSGPRVHPLGAARRNENHAKVKSLIARLNGQSGVTGQSVLVDVVLKGNNIAVDIVMEQRKGFYDFFRVFEIQRYRKWDISEPKKCAQRNEVLSRSCNSPCPGAVSDWSSWSACSRKCDLGIKMRSRTCSSQLCSEKLRLKNDLFC